MLLVHIEATHRIFIYIGMHESICFYNRPNYFLLIAIPPGTNREFHFLFTSFVANDLRSVNRWMGDACSHPYRSYRILIVSQYLNPHSLMVYFKNNWFYFFFIIFHQRRANPCLGFFETKR